MSALELYAKAALETKGIAHLQAISSLRKYLLQITDEEATRYINMITDLNILRTLIEAGMRAALLKAVLSRQRILTEGK